MTGLVSAALLVLTLASTVLAPPPPGPAPGPAPEHGSRTVPEPARAPTTAQWPLHPRPEVLTGFAPPAQDWLAGHRGVDLAGFPGQEVRAALAGTVTFAGRIAGRGVVVVEHGGRRTTYEPVAASAPRGTEVAAGDPIGTLEGSPGHCVPWVCLHWGLIAGSEYRDPLDLLSLGPVRLLPLLPDLLRRADGPGGRRSGAVRW